MVKFVLGGKMEIGILGAGAYAIALADILVENNHKVTLWTKFQDEKQYLNLNRNNKDLGNYIISNLVNITTDIKQVMNNDLVIFAIPGEFIKDVSLEIKPFINKQHFCIASKGIIQNETLFQIVNNIISTQNIGIISGPTFAIDVIKKIPIGFTLATNNKNTEKCIVNAFKNNRIAIELNNDIIGVSLCGSLKNIIAIACGIVNGLNLPISTQCLLITKAIYDIKTIINYYNGNENTILSLAGIGDIILTCTSEKSRNYTLGYMFGQKKDKKEIELFINNNTVEGITTLNQIENIINGNILNIPVIKCIYDIIYKKEKVQHLLDIIAK